ncbi:4749_t:CDS:2 [Ambispora gerdemannii]|uniref:4749_t:CDS:1 n=1 Tax=Ambispora gerdemannii TaxID=144530 RepID=A0A9N9FIS4_9GLOM|nr:4749_t:CDS:2 [Ambispora gerdemannii]
MNSLFEHLERLKTALFPHDLLYNMIEKTSPYTAIYSYNKDSHLKFSSFDGDANNLDHNDGEFTNSLKNLHIITTDYLRVPIEEAFNWNELAMSIPDVKGEWYVVAFRSIRRADADDIALYEADSRAHEEAKLNGGLLKYCYSGLNERRECLAMCVWLNRDYARAANGKPHHIAAMSLASKMYDTYALERYRLLKSNGELFFKFEKIIS